MKAILLRTICYFLYLSGIPWLIREIYARRNVTIINYHNPEPRVFEEHVKYYTRHYSFVSIDQIEDALFGGTTQKLPPRPLLVTFDDAYAGNAALFPVFVKFKIPAIIYVVAGLVGTKRHFWFDKIPHHGAEMKQMKILSDKERRELMKIKYNHWDEKEYDYPVALSQKELMEFINIGGVVGSHTMFHPMLDKCDSKTGLWECEASRSLLQEKLGIEIRHFALPNGQGNPKVLNWVKKAGYHTCRSIRPGWNNKYTSPFELTNFGISDDADVSKAAIQACGLWGMFKKYVP